MKTLIYSIVLCATVLLQAQKDPNILLILSDDHSYPYLGCYGNPDLKTPNLDRLAAEGILFNHAYTTAPQCVLSRASLLTGRNVLDIQMLRFSAPLDKDIITFPELFREAGYYTGICGRAYHLDGDGKALSSVGRSAAKESMEVYEEYGMQTFADRVDYLHNGHAGDSVLEHLRMFLDEVPEGKPFFMWANYSDPHRIFDADDYEPDPASITMPARIPDTRAMREDLAAHLGEINRLDTRVGQLVRELEMREILENTLIVFMGDNGAALLRGKGFLYDYGLHVPMIMRFPAMIRPGSVSNILVTGSDLAPTLLDVAGILPEENMTGKSFKHGFLGDETANHEFLYAVRGPHGSGLPGNSAAFDLSRTVFDKDYRFIYNPMFHLPYVPVDFGWTKLWKDLVRQAENGELDPRFYETAIFSEKRPVFEFFDLRNDPDEFYNLSGQEEFMDIEHKYKAELQRWMIINRDMVPLPIPPPKMQKPINK